MNRNIKKRDKIDTFECLRNGAYVVTLVIVAIVASSNPLSAFDQNRKDGNPRPVNIALGKQYLLSKKPSYPLCTDDGDKTDLTDGKLTEKGFWTQKSTVGWQHPRDTITITVDLGQVEPIKGAAMRSAGGGAGVTCPHSIVISVSDDNKNFKVVGDLIRLSQGQLPAPGYGEADERGVAHNFRTDRLQTRGRYVRFDIVPSGVFFFSDELEIYRGDDKTKSPTGPTLTKEYVTDKTRLTQLGCYRRIRRDTELVLKAVSDSALSSEVQAAAIKELEAVSATNEKQIFPASHEDFRAIIPLNNLHERVYAVYARLLSSQGVKPLSIWHTHPYQLLTPLDVPQGILTKLHVEMMRGERRAEVINITNASSERREIKISSSGLPFMQIRQVEWLDTREGRIVGSALFPIERRDNVSVVSIPSGMTRQLWLSFEPGENQSGDHTGRVSLVSDDFVSQVDLSVNVAPLKLSDQPRLALGTWDYIAENRYGITAANRAQAKAVLLDGLVNNVWCGAGTAPIPSRSHFDKQGNLISEPDYTKWDALVRMFPKVSTYSTFVGWHSKTSHYLGFERNTPEFKRAMAQWAGAWARHNRKLGLKPKQAMILFVDEPNGDYIHMSRLFGEAFRAGTDEIAIFNDPHARGATDHEDGDALFQISDFICPNLPHFLIYGKKVQDIYRALPDKGTKLWLYSCTGPTRMFDPSYFRLHAWQCFAEGATGQGFWAFGDNGGAVSNSFNEYTAIAAQSYTPVFIGPNLVATSKHWEAVREGVQDYEYLKMLADSVAARQKAGDDSSQVREAKELVDTLANQVINSAVKQDGRWYYSGQWGNQSTFADEGRIKVLQLLKAINADTNSQLK